MALPSIRGIEEVTDDVSGGNVLPSVSVPDLIFAGSDYGGLDEPDG